MPFAEEEGAGLMRKSVPNPIDEQATDWVIRMGYGQMTAEAEAEFSAWLKADRRHQGAFFRAKGALSAMEAPVVARPSAHLSWNDNEAEPASSYDRAPPEEGKGRRFGRWPVALGAAALAASLIGAALFHQARPVTDEVPKLVSLPVPEGMEEHALPDGSRALVRSGGEISIHYDGTVRKIILEKGEAVFHVAKDEKRPFVAQAGDVYAQATGTVYRVDRQGASGAAVRVEEGSVMVWAGNERDQAVLLRAGGSIMLDPGAAKQPAPQLSSLPPEIAELSFDTIPIATAIARFNRVNDRKIILRDETIGTIKIDGIFKANRPDEFAAAIAALGGAHVKETPNGYVIYVKQ